MTGIHMYYFTNVFSHKMCILLHFAFKYTVSVFTPDVSSHIRCILSHRVAKYHAGILIQCILTGRA